MNRQSDTTGDERRPTPSRRRLLRRALGAAALAAAGFVGFGVFVDRYGHTDQARPAEAIVILGARVTPAGVPGDSLRARTLQAVTLYRRGLAPKIICTGGLGDYPPTEAAAAAALATREGVPRADLLLEEKSTSTRENARNAARICREHGWTRVIVVSDPYHLWRASRDFTRAGLIPYPSPATACDRDRSLRLRLYWTAREELLALRDLIR